MSSQREKNQKQKALNNIEKNKSSSASSYSFLNRVHEQLIDTVSHGASYLDKFNETLQSRGVYQEPGNEFDPICQEHLDYIRALSKSDYDKLANFAEKYVNADYKFRKAMITAFFNNWGR